MREYPTLLHMLEDMEQDRVGTVKMVAKAIGALVALIVIGLLV